MKNAQGGFLQWGRLHIGRLAPPPGRVVANMHGATLGGFPGHAPVALPSEEPPAWAKAIIGAPGGEDISMLIRLSPIGA